MRLAATVWLGVAACAGCSSTASPDAEDAYSVVYTAEEGFVPNRLDVPTGATVLFVNDSDAFVWPASNIHPTHEVLPQFDPQRALGPGETWAYRFEENGYWRYHNHVEPSENGMIVSLGDADDDVEPLEMDMLEVAFPEPPATAAEDYDLYGDEDDLAAFVTEYGPAAAVELLKEIELRIPGTNCHDLAHEVGRIAFDAFGPITFALSLHECQSGALHGSLEALFAARGTASLAADVSVVCSQADNPFILHQCLHGIGHGVMAWTAYELHDALELCDLMHTQYNQSSCNSGVFMENVVGGLSGLMGHTTEYLQDDDPHFPCDAVEQRYVADCYFYQTSHMLKVFDYDYARIARACSEAPEQARGHCYASYGRDVGAATRGDPAAAVEYCGHAPDGPHRVGCIRGAVQDRFWEKTGADEAAAFCAMLGEESAGRDGCYDEIIVRARDVFSDPAERDAFCARLESSHRQQCRDSMAASG